MSRPFRFLYAAAIALLATAAPGLAQVVTWPSQPIRMIVPFPPGGAADLTARTIGEYMGGTLKQAVVVENRTGANGVLGMDAVAKAKPDGYTILMTDRGSLGINPSLYAPLPFDPINGFAMIGVAVEGPVVVVVDPKLGVKNAATFIALAKTKPLNFSSQGVGSIAQLNLEAFAQRAGIKMVHIPYKGAAPASLAVVQGDVAITITAPSTSLAHVNAGRLTAIAVNTAQRLPQFPDVATLAEQGMPDVMVSTFFALAAPAGTPRPIIERLNAELKAALAESAVAAKITGVGLVPAPSTPEAAAKLVADDIARFGALVKAVGIKPE